MTSRAVVIVSGGDAISPFTTPELSCGAGLAAGSTDTALRQALLEAGFATYTSPANAGSGPVSADTGFAGFSSPPPQLPAAMTVDAVGPIDAAGERLATFLAFLTGTYGIDEVDLVGHSMGGLFSRAAVRELKQVGHGLRVRSLITLGTPWEGSFAADYANGTVPIEAAEGDRGTETIMQSFKEATRESSTGAGEQVTRHYLAGPNGWNARQAGILDDIPVTLIAGAYFAHDGGAPQVWPHDGLATVGSALATSTPSDVLPSRQTHTFDDVHSIYFADQFSLPWEKALTWDPVVHATVVDALGR